MLKPEASPNEDGSPDPSPPGPDWPMWWPILLLAGFGVMVPAVSAFWPFLKIWKFHLAGTTTLVLLLGLRARNPEATNALGFRSVHWIRSLLPGFGSGLLIVLIPIALELLIDNTALSKEPLFQGAEGRVLDRPELGVGILLEKLVWIPLFTQTAITGFLISRILKKRSLPQAVITAALLFPLVLGRLSPAVMGLGIVSTLLFRKTGSLTAPLVFHGCAGLSGLLLAYSFPKSVTLLSLIL